jgi:tartrate dehydrogenase/decarboxylase/D-malate dehydrogenase
MLEFLGQSEAADLIMQGIEATTLQKIFTKDLGGIASTANFGNAVCANIAKC